MPSDSIAFDHAASFYDATRGFPPGEDRAVAALIAEAAELDASMRLLEIGIGTGRIALPLSRHVGAIIGLDLARPMMDRLREKRADEPVFLMQGDATELPFPPRTFDAAMTVHVLHLIPPWRRALDELKRVLRPGGVLIYGMNNRGEGHPGLQAISDAYRAIIPSHNDQGKGMPRGKEEESLAEAGWERVGEERIHRFTIRRTPQGYIDHLANRCGSGTWDWSDEVIEQAVAATRQAAEAHFSDLNTPIEVQSSFHVRVYRPRA